MTSVVDFINKNFSPSEMQALGDGISSHDAQLIADEHNGRISPQEFVNKINPQLLHVLADRQRQNELAAQPVPGSAASIGQNVPFAGHALADLATGGTAIGNDLRSLVGAAPDTTDYYKAYGIQPNIADQIAAQGIRSVPYTLAPEAAIKNLGSFVNAPTLTGLLARAGIRGATGVGANEMTDPVQQNKIGMDALSGLDYAGTGLLGDMLPYSAAKLVNNAINQRLPNAAIEDGNRAAIYPDTGNVVGNSPMAQKWNKQTQTLFSPAKDIQQGQYANLPAQQYQNIKDADNKTLSLYDSLIGDAKPGSVPESISQDIQKTFAANKATGNAKYQAIQPDLENLSVDDTSTIKKTAQSILDDASKASSFGVTNNDLKNDLISRAQNAINRDDSDLFPASQAIDEARNLQSISSELKARGDNNAARYYDMLSGAYNLDTESAIKNSDPDLYDKYSDAKDYWKNNVIPFYNTPVSNKIINNSFDEDVQPINLSNSLTNGSNAQLLDILPTETHNKIAADLLFNKGFNALGDANNPSISLTKALSSTNQNRLAPVLDKNPQLAGQLTDIAKTVNANQDVMNSLSSPTKTVAGDDISPTVGPHGIWDHVKNLPGVFTSPYWSNLLSTQKTPGLLQTILNSQKGDSVGLNDIRNLTAPDSLTQSLTNFGFVRSPVVQTLSNPNFTRLPASTLLNVKEQNDGNQ